MIGLQNFVAPARRTYYNVVSMSQDITLAYAAGLLDGEGHYGIAKSAVADSFIFRARVAVRMTHKPTIDWLKSQFGGSTAQNERRPYTNQEVIYSWELCHRSRLTQFLPEMIRFSRTKRVQACLLLEFLQNFPNSCTTRINIGLRLDQLNRYYEVMRGLNSVGPGSSKMKDDLSNVLKFSEQQSGE